MGVFAIRPRSVKLDNLSNPGTRQVHVPSQRIGAGATEQWRAAAGLGRDIMHAGGIAANIASDMMQRRRMIEEAEAEAEFERSFRETMTNPENGLSLRLTNAGSTDELKSVVDEANGMFRTSAEKFLDEKGYKGDEKRRMLLRLKSVTDPYERMVSKGVLEKTRQFEISSADSVFNEKQQSWQANQADAQLTAELIDAYRASQVVRGLDDATVDANTDAVVRGMAYDMVSRNVAAANREQLDRTEVLVANGDSAELLWENDTLSNRFAGKDPFAYSAGRRGLETVTAKDGILAAIAARRRELDRLDNEAVEKVVNEGIQAASVIRDENGNYPANRLAKIEESMFEAKRLSETMPKGSAAAANAAAGVDHLNKLADQVAQFEIMNDLANGEKPPAYGLRHDGKTYKGTGWLGELKIPNGGVATEYSVGVNIDGKEVEIPTLVPGLSEEQKSRMVKDIIPKGKKVPEDIMKIAVDHAKSRLAKGESVWANNGNDKITKGSPRKERLFPAVYAAFEKKAFRASHEQNLLKIRGAMIDYAAENNPQGFYNFLAQAVVDKHITPGDFTRLRNEFTEGWMKGFKAAPEQMARQSSMAKKMLEAMNDKLGVDLSVAIKTDDYGDPVVRNGMLDWDDKAELPDASVGREFQKIVRRGDLFMGQGTRTATRKETIEGEMLKTALNEAMTLWSLNGLKIGYDPVTGERLPEGQTHEVNVVEDFNALLDRLADERNVLTAAEELKRQSSGYMNTVRLFGETEERGRRARATGSNPITDNQDETEEK